MDQFNSEGIYLSKRGICTSTLTVPNAHAVRYLAQSGTFVQAPDVGNFWDVSMARYSDTIVVVSRGPVSEVEDPSR